MAVAVNEDSDLLFRIQSEALRRADLSDAAKLQFCRLMCLDGFRSGWLVTDSRWSLPQKESIDELDRVGLVEARRDGDGNPAVRIRPCGE